MPFSLQIILRNPDYLLIKTQIIRVFLDQISKPKNFKAVKRHALSSSTAQNRNQISEAVRSIRKDQGKAKREG